MSVSYAIGGLIILLAATGAIILMLAVHYKLVADARIEEARLKEQRRAVYTARRMARQMAEEAIRNAHFTVQIQTINETKDIYWGDE